MPKGTKVHRLYEELKKQGHSVESAVRIAQDKTGQALATGKPPKHPSTKKTPIHESKKFQKK
jgi:hypothetical protein